MAEQDSLSNDNFNTLLGSGAFTKFRSGIPLTLRVLTTDPVVSESEFTNKDTGEITLRTSFAFIVYNFTEEKAQILRATPSMARWIGEKHNDPDFGSNIRSVDIKITPSGEGLQRRYDFQVLPKTRTLTKEMVDEAKAIDLDNSIRDSRGRMSQLISNKSSDDTTGYEKAKQKAEELRNSKNNADLVEDARVKKEAEDHPDDIIDPGEEPINLDDIPF